MGDMMRLLAVLVIFALSSICLANLANDVTPCGDVTRPIEIYVEGCPAVPCTVRNGTSVQFRFTWIPAADSYNLTANVNLMLGSLAIPFTLDDTDGCNALVDSQCPIYSQNPVTVETNMAVVAPIVGVSVDLEYFLTGHDGHRSVCFRYRQTITA